MCIIGEIYTRIPIEDIQGSALALVLSLYGIGKTCHSDRRICRPYPLKGLTS